MTTARRHRAVGALALIAALTAACQDSESDKEGKGDPSAATQDDALIKFASCMRDNGVPMDDPKPGGRLMIDQSGIDPSILQAAQDACSEFLDDAIGGGGQPKVDASMKESLLAQAACMRKRGWDIPDPEFDGGKVQGRLGSNVDFSDPSFQKDQAECAKESGLQLPGGG